VRPLKRWFGFKTNDGAIQLSHDVEHPGAIDLRRRATNQAAGKRVASTVKSIQNEALKVDSPRY